MLQVFNPPCISTDEIGKQTDKMMELMVTLWNVSWTVVSSNKLAVFICRITLWYHTAAAAAAADKMLIEIDKTHDAVLWSP